MTDYPVVKKDRPTLYFIGVTTGQSSINKVFPLWMNVLGRPEVVIEGIDHPIHDAPEHYRRSVAQIKGDPNSLGALVTTHKIDLYNAARDLFDYFDPYAQITGEVSSISKRGSQLRGHAKDPINAGLSLNAITLAGLLRPNRRTTSCVWARAARRWRCCCTCSTSPQAIIRRSSSRSIRRRIDSNRCGRWRRSYPTTMQIDTVHNGDAVRNDAILATLPEHSLVINATGMGKDTPGSPLTDAGVFPQHGIAWELNYRGERDFMQQALRQVERRDLRVEDGWVYFIHGWSSVIFEVLDLKLTPELFAQLEQAAASVRKEEKT